MTTELVTREYRIDTPLHLYRPAHLEDPQYVDLIPLCEENKMYPERHPRRLLGINQLPGSYLDRCASCDVADRRERRAAQGATR